jgi:hypothetical protein
MQFGKRAAEAPKMTGGESSEGVRWMRTLKPGEYRMRFLDETDDWIMYWEHYNPTPGGFPFPCTGDKKTCPGCTSGIEKMEKASPKYAVNAKIGEFVDIYKFPTKFFNKMEIRSERNGGTITDRDYMVTRIGNDTSTDYDIDMLSKSDLDKSLLQKRRDIQKSLEAAFYEAWPDFKPENAQDAVQEENQDAKEQYDKGMRQAHGYDEPKPEAAPEPAGEKEVTEAELRAMTPDDLKILCKNEQINLPDNLETTNQIVDWMLENL